MNYELFLYLDLLVELLLRSEIKIQYFILYFSRFFVPLQRKWKL